MTGQSHGSLGRAQAPGCSSLPRCPELVGVCATALYAPTGSVYTGELVTQPLMTVYFVEPLRTPDGDASRISCPWAKSEASTMRAHAAASELASWCTSAIERCAQTVGSRASGSTHVFRASSAVQSHGRRGGVTPARAHKVQSTRRSNAAWWAATNRAPTRSGASRCHASTNGPASSSVARGGAGRAWRRGQRCGVNISVRGSSTLRCSTRAMATHHAVSACSERVSKSIATNASIDISLHERGARRCGGPCARSA